MTRLLADLQDRGLDVTAGVFVVDGSKALTKGIPAVFGDKAVVHWSGRDCDRNAARLSPTD